MFAQKLEILGLLTTVQVPADNFTMSVAHGLDVRSLGFGMDPKCLSGRFLGSKRLAIRLTEPTKVLHAYGELCKVRGMMHRI